MPAPFVEDPAVIELFNAVMELERAVNAAAYVDPVWRKRWKEFVRRWRAEFAAYDALGDELTAKDGRPRLDRYGAAFQAFDAHWESGIPQRQPPASSSSAGGGFALVLVALAVALAWGKR
jgi:hypothetical protein